MTLPKIEAKRAIIISKKRMKKRKKVFPPLPDLPPILFPTNQNPSDAGISPPILFPTTAPNPPKTKTTPPNQTETKMNKKSPAGLDKLTKMQYLLALYTSFKKTPKNRKKASKKTPSKTSQNPTMKTLPTNFNASTPFKHTHLQKQPHTDNIEQNNTVSTNKTTLPTPLKNLQKNIKKSVKKIATSVSLGLALGACNPEPIEPANQAPGDFEIASITPQATSVQITVTQAIDPDGDEVEYHYYIGKSMQEAKQEMGKSQELTVDIDRLDSGQKYYLDIIAHDHNGGEKEIKNGEFITKATEETEETPELTFEQTLAALAPLVQQVQNGENIDHVIIPGTTKTYAQHQAEWGSYISHGSYESPQLLGLIAGDSDIIEMRYSEIDRRHFLFKTGTFDPETGVGKAFHLLLQDRIGRHFEDKFVARFNVDDVIYANIFNRNSHFYTAWIDLIRPIYEMTPELTVSTDESNTVAQFDEHLRQIGPFFSPLLELPPETEEAILQDIKSRLEAEGHSL